MPARLLFGFAVIATRDGGWPDSETSEREYQEGVGLLPPRALEDASTRLCASIVFPVANATLRATDEFTAILNAFVERSSGHCLTASGENRTDVHFGANDNLELIGVVPSENAVLFVIPLVPVLDNSSVLMADATLHFGNVACAHGALAFELRVVLSATQLQVAAPVELWMIRCPKKVAVFAVHLGHDATMVALVDGVVAVALELERLHGIRYYTAPYSAPRFRAELAPAVAIVNHYSKFSCYDQGVIVRLGTDQEETEAIRLMMLRQLVCASKWSFVDHHLSHATYALIDSPFNGFSLVASFDSGGNDGEFNLYLGSNSNLSLLLDTGLRVGNAYTVVATFIPNVTGVENGTTAWTELHTMSASLHHLFFEAATPTANSCGGACLGFLLALPGKLMAFAALGVVREDLVDAIDGIFGQRHARSDHPMKVGILPEPLASTRVEDLAASVQAWFSRKVVDTILSQLDLLQEQQPHKEMSGIVLTGGCALNVRANSDLMLQAAMPVYVPAAPGDSGLAVGAAYHAFFSGRPGQDVPKVRLSAYTGVHLWDLPDVPHLAVEHQASPLALPELAKMLAEGQVAAIVRGRSEFGPRSLGHRSLMAYPANADVKARLNRLKSRGWYRPVALTMPATMVAQLFVVNVDAMFSPFMSFAPSLLPSSAKRFPAIAHIDGTCRVQTIDRETESWLFDLLLAVGALTGAPLLANTSLNLKGQPILNRATDALSLFRTQKEIDVLVLEDWIVRAGGKNGTHLLR